MDVNLSAFSILPTRQWAGDITLTGKAAATLVIRICLMPVREII